MTRSIFVKGSQLVRSYGAAPSLTPTTDLGIPTTTQATTTPYWSPETTLVFNGASDVDGQLYAFVENSALNSIQRYQAGDAIALGKIARITLDQLDYLAGGRVTHVLIGQNLAGVEMQVLTTQPVSATTGPAGPGPAGGADSILERLRLRRLQELGGK